MAPLHSLNPLHRFFHQLNLKLIATMNENDAVYDNKYKCGKMSADVIHDMRHGLMYELNNWQH
jgi:hypothetical protein